MTQDILSKATARAPLAAHAATVAKVALVALLPACALAATGMVPTHPRVYQHHHAHTAGYTPAAISRRSAHHAAEARPVPTKHVSARQARRQARAETRMEARAAALHMPRSADTPRSVVLIDAKADEHATAVAAAAPIKPQTLRGRLANFFFGPLRGSHESLVRQNVRAQQDGLAPLQDDTDIARQVEAGRLVAIPDVAGLRVDDRLPLNRRYTRVWTAHFLSDLARAHDAQFHSDIQVNSAIRTVEFQKHLLRVNGNAAPASGEDASSHLRGGTVDLAKKGMGSGELQWMRAYLAELQNQGRIDVEEEFKQSCFHIAVYKSYMPQMPQRLLAENGQPRLHMESPQN